MSSSMSAPRRSKRLRAVADNKEKRLERQRLRNLRRIEGSDSSSSYVASEQEEQSEAESDVSRTVAEDYVSPIPKMKKTNNFLKVYSSYNMDRDMDCYENDFIDDSDIMRQRVQLRRKQKLQKALTPQKRRSKVLDVSSDSDSEKETVVDGSCSWRNSARRAQSNSATLGTPQHKKPKKVMIDSSSDNGVDATKQMLPSRKSLSLANVVMEETVFEQVKRTEPLDSESDDDERPFRRASSSSRRAAANLCSSSSSDEGDDVFKKAPVRRRRVKISPDSDSDIPVSQKRSLSIRAEQIREQKQKETDKKLQELRLLRARKTVPKELAIEVDGHKLDVVENEQEVAFERQRTLEEYFAPEPPRDLSYAVSSESGSGSEINSDWLISDHDDSSAGQDLEVALDPFMSEMVVQMNLGGVTRTDLCSDMTSTSLAENLILAVASADVNVCQDLVSQFSTVRSAAHTLQDLNLNLLELTIVAPLVNGKSSSPYKFVPDVDSNGDTRSPNDQPSSTNLFPSNTESCLSIEHTSLCVQSLETTPCRSHSNLSPGKDVSADAFFCLQQLCCHRKWFCKELCSSISRYPTAVELAVWHNRSQCLTLLIEVAMEMKIDWTHPLSSAHSKDISRVRKFLFESSMAETWPPSLLHLPLVSCICGVLDCSCASMLQILLPCLKKEVNLKDSEEYTPIMYAAQLGDHQSVKLLLDNGACIQQKDREGQSCLHLAAASGCLQCVKELLEAGHAVDCQDKKGWPPLLYAHFSGHEDCFLALMSAKPEQLSVLSALLHRTERDGTDNRRKTAKVVRELLVTLAHTESYHSLFNEFINSNMSILEEEEFDFMKHCMGLLSFENKKTWLRMKLNNLKSFARNQCVNGLQFVDLPRTDILERTLCHMWSASALDCWMQEPCVTFLREVGTCTGPRKEFWTCVSRELVEGRGNLFSLADDSQLSVQPCKVFTGKNQTLIAKFVHRHHHKLMLVGMLFATAVFHEDTLDCNLSKPVLKQLLGWDLSHPASLEDVDKHLFDQLKSLKDEDRITDLGLTFSLLLPCPWDQSKHVVLPLTEGGTEMEVTDSNKMEYVKSYSRFKLEGSVKAEVDALRSGFWKVVPRRYLRPFSANEFSLLLSGVSSISVDDWRRNTLYSKCLPGDEMIKWFWALVADLKQDEKGLLLKFCTGSPRLPPGGFAHLTGLNGPTKFTISLEQGTNRIPSAQTCFNRLYLSHYTSEQDLRNKVLIALRYGCEGFEFS